MKKTNLFAIFLAAGVMLATTGANAAGCAVPSDLSKLLAQTVQMVNKERAAGGRKPLAVNTRLSASAQAHACDMAVKGYFGHRGRDGSSPKRRLRRQGCNGGLVAENIAAGLINPRKTVQNWMTSPGHRKIMLLGRGVNNIGIGIVKSGKAYSHGYVWVMVVSRGC